MRSGVPIKVSIGLRPNGHADHPDWSRLGLADPDSHMVMKWAYDKVSGHQDDTPDSPYGQQFGMLVVTPEFAQAALLAFPDIVTLMTEIEARDFYENRCTVHLPANLVNAEYLMGLKTQRDLMVDTNARPQDLQTLDAQIARAIDPLDPMDGVRKIKDKTWADMKAARGIAITSL